MDLAHDPAVHQGADQRQKHPGDAARRYPVVDAFLEVIEAEVRGVGEGLTVRTREELDQGGL